MKTKHFRIASIIACLIIIGCKSSFKNSEHFNSDANNPYSVYDDSTLTNTSLPIMMPHNRIINPAGSVISYGSPDLENHSLDLQLLPNTNLLVIEDRYGIAVLNSDTHKVVDRWTYADNSDYKDFMSTYSGIQIAENQNSIEIFWSAANNKSKVSKVFKATWEKNKLQITNSYDFMPKGDSPLALPNEIALSEENGTRFLYVVLNGNNSLEKINLENKETVWSTPTGVAPYGIVLNGNQAFVTNWAGDIPSKNTTKETAGVPYGATFINPKTGATASGSVSVIATADGKLVKNIEVGLHPNDIISSNDQQTIYVSNSNSDYISVINAKTLKVVDIISIKIDTEKHGFIGDSPNALSISSDDSHLYVANGMDNAIAVVNLLQKNRVEGFIPTEAYPGGVITDGENLYVTNLEGEGARVNSLQMDTNEKFLKDIKSGAYNSHHQKATVSIIPMPNASELTTYTQRVKDQMLHFRMDIAKLSPRKNQLQRPVPERIGEASLFKHVIYIIKENRTYDQVFGDLSQGNGEKGLCIFGDSITPNQHQLAKDFVLLDNYYASGKCSAEGHQWTDAAMVSDYVEKNVRAWFRSYPHVQEDALVYNKKGFLWNNAADHGKAVRIYGEASQPNIDPKLNWKTIYENYKAGIPLVFNNTTTISRVAPMLSKNYPGSDELKVTDQIRADAFIKELQDYEALPGDQFPELSIMALSLDHTTGTRPDMPTPRAMVADNDLALGRIIEAVTKSKFWKNTVIFVTEDDSQAGWDHVSAYRTTCLVVSPYSRLQKTVSTNYNQTSMVRSIEQILGIPPMNLMDATALPMFNCFNESAFSLQPYQSLTNKIPLDEMNPSLNQLKGKALTYAKQSMRPEYDHIDAGDDDVLNRILWFSSKGKKSYPFKLAGKDLDEDDD